MRRASCCAWKRCFLGAFLCCLTLFLLGADGACETMPSLLDEELYYSETAPPEDPSPAPPAPPASQAPASQAPASQAPASQAPASQAPASQAPASQAPALKAADSPEHAETATQSAVDAAEPGAEGKTPLPDVIDAPVTISGIPAPEQPEPEEQPEKPQEPEEPPEVFSPQTPPPPPPPLVFDTPVVDAVKLLSILGAGAQIASQTETQLPIEAPPVEPPPPAAASPVEPPPPAASPPVEQPLPAASPPVEQPLPAASPPVEQPPPAASPPVEQPPLAAAPPVEQPPLAETTPPAIAAPRPAIDLRRRPELPQRRPVTETGQVESREPGAGGRESGVGVEAGNGKWEMGNRVLRDNPLPTSNFPLPSPETPTPNSPLPTSNFPLPSPETPTPNNQLPIETPPKAEAALAEAPASTAETDESVWEYAQECEKPGPGRSLKAAYEAYKRLYATWPQSAHAAASRTRAAWLEKYFLNIR